MRRILRNHSEESTHLFFIALIEEYTKFLNQKLKIIIWKAQGVSQLNNAA